MLTGPPLDSLSDLDNNLVSITCLKDMEVLMSPSVSRRTFAALGLTATASVALSGCISGNPSDNSSQKQTGDKYSGEIEWWTINLQKVFHDYIQGMIDAYTKQHPDVKIKWVDVPGQDITTKLLAAIASGKVPDAVNYTSATTGLFGDQMSDLSQYFSADELAAYAPGLVKPLKGAGGGQIAVPWYNGGTTLAFYNTSLLKAIDFDPKKPPSTIDDALALAKTYNTKTGKFATNFTPSVTALQSAGVTMLSADKKKAAFNTPETLELIEKFKPLYDSHAIAPGAITADVRNPPQSLSNGLIAFGPMDTSTDLVRIKEEAPKVYAAMAVEKPVTGIPDKYVIPGQQIFGIPKKSDNQAAAAEWLKFVTSSDNQLAFCKLVAIYPSTLATLKDPFFTDITGTDPASVARKTLVETFPGSTDGSLGSGNDEQLSLLFANEIRAYLPGKKSAQQALDDAEKAWNEQLAKSQ